MKKFDRPIRETLDLIVGLIERHGDGTPPIPEFGLPAKAVESYGDLLLADIVAVCEGRI